MLFRSWGELGPIYGKQWREWKYETTDWYDGHTYHDSEFKSIDQIANSINLLKTDPDSRRNRVSAWNVGELDQMTLPPCHTDFQFYTRELSLEERHKISMDRIGHNGITNRDDLSWHETYDKTNILTRAISLMFKIGRAHV